MSTQTYKIINKPRFWL